MIVSVEGSNAESLRKALKKLRVPTSRMSWSTIDKNKEKYLCMVHTPTEEEEVVLLKYGEIR